MSEWSPLAKVYDPLKAGSIDSTDVEPHDRAIWRAMNAEYRPNKGITGDPQLTLFVSRLNKQTSEEDLKKMFSAFGDIRRLRIVRDAVTGFSKGYAFIEYKEERSLMKAWRDANKMVVDQHELFVDFELERTLQGWVPRRLGGGLGGKKESGQLRFGGRDRPFRRPINLGGPMPQGRAAERRWDGGGGGGGGGGGREERLRDRDASPGRDRDYGRRREQRDDWERGNERGARDYHKGRRDSRRYSERSSERELNRGKEERRYRDSYRDSERR
ncbi:U11/U12 small nuclear ribonucleoprotein 35 kDa protein [Salminus brasiliensis]|uniref:U11/U12 small nuclear ribonucleoprotein 35 kDa protein n=1 Tax=Salminus brasiliensis TaxID=930266 RepID=UPI003B83758F